MSIICLWLIDSSPILSSNVRWTQKRAIDLILDVSVEYRMVRLLMKQWGAIDILEHVRDFYSHFRFANDYIDNLLLSISRKALVSFRDSQLNALLVEWRNIRDCDRWILRCEEEKQMKRNIKL